MKFNRLRSRCKHGSGFFIAMLMAGTAYDAHALLNHEMTYMEEMGKRLFFNDALSLNNNMSCSTCHSSNTGGIHGDSETNRVIVGAEGSDPGKFGSLRPPTNKYVEFFDDEGTPQGLTTFDAKCAFFFGSVPCGGAFWNGRAKGESIDPDMAFEGLEEEYKEMYKHYMGPVVDQAHASPWINPVEQALPNKQAVCDRVEETNWGKELYKYAWGTELRCDEEHLEREFARFSMSVGAWQMSRDNNSFKSNRDIFLMRDYDGQFPLDHFTEEENHGHDLFYAFGPGGAGCAACHRSGNFQGTSKFERYTADQYFNIGLPYNHEIMDSPDPDPGVWATIELPDPTDPTYEDEKEYRDAQKGKHKVPTVRNVDKRPYPGFTKAYMHNGWFKKLEDVVHFYNSSDVSLTETTECVEATTNEEKLAVSTACWLGKTRCPTGEWTAEQAIEANCWPEPELPEAENNIPRGVVGNLGLSTYDEAALVAYLKTLTDREDVRYPRPYISRRYDKRRLSH